MKEITLQIDDLSLRNALVLALTSVGIKTWVVHQKGTLGSAYSHHRPDKYFVYFEVEEPIKDMAVYYDPVREMFFTQVDTEVIGNIHKYTDHRRNNMELKETKFYEFVKKFFEEHGRAFENNWSVYHQNELPFDSVDRLIALFMLESYPEMVGLDLLSITTDKDALEWYASLDPEFKEWFDSASNWAYNNYEREWISNAVALMYILAIAKQGTDEILTNSYATGGWFGAS